MPSTATAIGPASPAARSSTSERVAPRQRTQDRNVMVPPCGDDLPLSYSGLACPLGSAFRRTAIRTMLPGLAWANGPELPPLPRAVPGRRARHRRRRTHRVRQCGARAHDGLCARGARRANPGAAQVRDARGALLPSPVERAARRRGIPRRILQPAQGRRDLLRGQDHPPGGRRLRVVRPRRHRAFARDREARVCGHARQPYRAAQPQPLPRPAGARSRAGGDGSSRSR